MIEDVAARSEDKKIELLIPEGSNEGGQVIVTWDGDAGEWAVLEGCTVDPVNHTVAAPVIHLLVRINQAVNTEPLLNFR